MLRIALFSCLLATTSLAQGTIIGSKHDFSGRSWNSGQEICIVCHTPHGEDIAMKPIGYLWNHKLSSATYTLYEARGNIEYPRPASQQCLACHDGTVAVDDFGGRTGGTEFVTGNAKIGTDLSGTHPISVEWDHQINLPNCSRCHNVHGNLFGSQLPFRDGYIECSTCHDPHGNAGFPSFLRMTMDGSTLCIYCHNK